MYDHDLELWNGSMSNINTQMERTYATLYLLEIAMFAQSVTIYEKFAIEMYITVTFRMSQCQFL